MSEQSTTERPATRRHRRASEPAPAPGCGTILSGTPISRGDADTLAGLLKAVADPVRLQLLSLIGSSEAGEMCVCDLTEPIGLSQPTVSHHLRILTNAGLLARERRASWVWYSLVPDAMNRIRTFL